MLPESSLRQIKERCFKTIVLTAFFICLGAMRHPSSMGVDSCLVVALRFSTGGLRCSRSSAHSAAVESTSHHHFKNILPESSLRQIKERCFKTIVLTAFFICLGAMRPHLRWEWIPVWWLPCASRPEVCDAHARRRTAPLENQKKRQDNSCRPTREKVSFYIKHLFLVFL